jgi:hypothetical protein
MWQTAQDCTKRRWPSSGGVFAGCARAGIATPANATNAIVGRDNMAAIMASLPSKVLPDRIEPPPRDQPPGLALRLNSAILAAGLFQQR